MKFRHTLTLSSQRRRVLQTAGAGMLALFTPVWVQAATWRKVEPVLKSVGDASVSENGLELILPLVAEDGSSVPLTVKGAAQIKKLEIFAPGNPTPEVAVFEFGPEIPTLNLATRIRLSDSQTVVAVAHGADGSVYVAERAVRVTTSGCVAPARSDPASEMQGRIRLPKSLKAGDAAEVVTMISHPMITGLQPDASGEKPAPRIIERFEASLDDRPVVRATFFRSLAANPYLKFDIAPQQGGEMRFQWLEDTGRKTELTQSVNLA